MIMPRIPRLAIVSTGIRRDLLAPLKSFSKFEVLHLYRHAEYGDLTEQDLGNTLHRYGSPVDLYRQLISARPDIIQGVEPFSLAQQPYLWACYFAARRVKARLLVAAFENRPLAVKFGAAPAFILRSLLRIYLKQSCLVIVLNEGARRNAVACGADPARVVKAMWGTWGVDLDEFSPKDPPPQAPTVLFAGRLAEEKGILVLLDALRLLCKEIPSARLLIVGDGPLRETVEAFVRKHLAPGMATVVGKVKHRNMPEYFRSATVLASPSITTRKWEEQVGMVALQAMACGVPVVSTRSGAIPEYVPPEAGILVAERDAAALAQALADVLSNGAMRERMSRAARVLACAHYDAAANIAKAEGILMERCGARRN